MKTSVQGVTFKDREGARMVTPSWVIKAKINQMKEKDDDGQKD